MTGWDVLGFCVITVLGAVGLRWAGLDWYRACGLAFCIVAVCVAFELVWPT